MCESAAQVPTKVLANWVVRLGLLRNWLRNRVEQRPAQKRITMA